MAACTQGRNLIFSVALLLAAGQVSYDTVPLADVVARTELVITMTLDTPASTGVKIPVPSSTGKKDCGTYEYGVYSGQVADVLFPSQGASVAAGTRVVVFLANTPELLELSTRACEEGGSESPIFNVFEGATPKDGATLTVFLRWSPGLGWTEAVSGAWLAKPPSKERLKGAITIHALAFDAKRRASDSALCVVDDDCTRTELVCNVCAPCTDAGGPVARAAAWRFRMDCFESLGRPPSPCGPCIVEGAPKVACRAMKCVDAPKTPPVVAPQIAPTK